MTRFVDHRAGRAAVGRCVVLPGRQYTPDLALLDAAAGDHVLSVPGDPAATAASHEQFVRSFDAWLTGLSS